MNCKPGDLAIVVAGSAPLYDSMLVDVLYAAPTTHDFTLPDGNGHHAIPEANWWICKSLGTPFRAPIGVNGIPSAMVPRMYGAIPDWALRPLRGEPESTDTRQPETVRA